MKIALVTGATDGIGRETARQLLSHGWRVFVHGRSEEKAEHAAHELADHPRRSSGFRAFGRAEAVWGDLARMAEVVQLAHQVSAKTEHLDVLINNAGVFETTRHVTPDGFELTMAVNHFAPFLLTHHLLAALEKSSAGRVITVSSIAHHNGALDVDDLSFARGYEGHVAYAASKLANVLFTRTLAQRLAGTRVSTYSLHPGVITTKLLWAGFKMRGKTVEEGARTSVFLATSEHVPGESGGYFVDCALSECSADARDERLGLALWMASEQALAKYLTGPERKRTGE
jgi:NAD(P)-dependent dehydrogenase (short-subunit alcohol dehydrogenase family)